MGDLNDKHIASIFAVKRTRVAKPTGEQFLAEVGRQLDRKRSSRIAFKSVAVVLEIAVLALLFYLYFLKR